MKYCLPKALTLFLLCFLLSINWLSAQIGGAFYADFHLSGKGRQGQATSMVQDAEGNMQMATLGGVVVFDGSNTTLVGTGALTNVLEHVSENQKTYAGCDGRIGYIKRNNFGKFVFNRIDLPNVEDQGFATIVNIGKDVYFQSTDWVIKLTDDKITGKWKRPNEGNFAGIFVIQNVVFVNISSSGLYTLQPNSKFKKVPINDSRLAEEEIMFAAPRSKNEVLLGTSANEILLFNGSQLQEIVCEKASYLQTQYLLDGKKLNNNSIVLATYYGGLLVMDMYNGRVSEMFSTATGFPDDQIYSLAVDKAQGIWANHEVGFTRIDRNIPVKYFSSYPGLSSRVYSVAESNGNLFVGCSDGLYRLKEVENQSEYDQAVQKAQEIKKAEKVKQTTGGGGAKAEIDDPGESNIISPAGPTNAPDVQTNPDNPTAPDETTIDRAGKRIKKIWRRVKDKIPGSTEGDGPSGGTSNPNGIMGMGKAQGVTYQPRFSNGRIYQFVAVGEPKAAQFIYSKVPGLESKVKKILVVPVGLICVTNTGLFEYSAAGIRKLFDGEIKDAMMSDGKIVFVTPSGPYIIGTDGAVNAININAKYRNLNTVYLENANTLWLGGTNHVLKVSLASGHQVSSEKFIEIPAEFPDYINICKSGNVLFFVSGGGLFEYQPSTGTAVSTSVVSSAGNEILEYVINPAGNTLFVKTMEGWKEVKNHNEQTNMGLMDVLNDVRYVYKSSNGNIWAVSNKGDIYYLNRNSPAGASFNGFGVFFRGVVGFDGKPFDLSDLSISYREAAVEVKWGSNLYLKSDGTWYQYKIEGTGRNQWSQWTKETSLKIQLKPGNYTFVVRARDIMGNISPEERLSFSIKPPFWQTWWFYTILALLLGGLIYFIFRWRNRALIENQKRLEIMVKERTRELGEEKEKTEELLLNILPKAVAQELKEKGHSSVRRHSESAVMFTDFCNFTKLSMNITAEQLVEKLDTYFRKFDEIVDKYGLEKIKTIGDAYMCAAGVPQPRPNCSLAIVMAAIEIIDIVQNAESHWQIRVGIHRGGLVSGVVGKRKFAYDIWGDTVNVASRMESSSEPMQINITEQVYEEIKDYFECEKRGEIEAKSLGKTNMYFVKGLKPKYKLNENSLGPNNDFLKLLN
ncbi:MAG: hypothetical protein IT244_00815 [Bacteroidia bacterium]|nr:hypothetical protein [Bacteroidia bacterium]